MKFLVCSILVLTALAGAQDPDNVLIYYDEEAGFGTAVNVAAANLWPTANIESYQGYPGAQHAAFNAALDGLGAGWDIIVIESWYANTDELYWGGVNDLYDTGAAKIYASTWQWTGASGQAALGNAMGVTGFTPFYAPVIPHYAWEPAHPIADGISDWGWSDPGINILNARLTVSDAVPVTGWTASATAGEAGICVANDGFSVISGYTPAYANESIAIWENILGFMWGTSELQQSTWGAIKSSF